jgi:nicotinamide mononucleotide transporter
LNIFNIHNTLTSIFGYPLSWVEATGAFMGLISVWFAVKENMLTWGTGLISIVCFFAIFYQVQLYSDMFLQIYFFITSIYGWATWKNQRQKRRSISRLTVNKRILLSSFILILTVLTGILVKNIHTLFPKLFIHPASSPFIDTFIAISSIVAMILLAKRIIENWVLWIIVDVICVFVYTKQHILFVSVEFGVFVLLAISGLFLWIKSIRNDHRISIG